MPLEDAQFDELIDRAHALDLRDPGDARWSALLPKATTCEGFVQWAAHHPRWRFNVADVADRVCAKPLEAAVMILADIVAELRDEAP